MNNFMDGENPNKDVLGQEEEQDLVKKPKTKAELEAENVQMAARLARFEEAEAIKAEKKAKADAKRDPAKEALNNGLDRFYTPKHVDEEEVTE